MITPDQREIVDRLLFQTEDAQEIANGVERLTTPEQLFCFAAEYNWDDGFEIPTIIAEHPSCDRATALLLFWRAEAIECLNAESPPKPQEAWFAFCKMITQRLLNGHFSTGPNAFDPELGKSQRYRYEKRGISPLLLDAEKCNEGPNDRASIGP